jgi:hypothetical protein
MPRFPPERKTSGRSVSGVCFINYSKYFIYPHARLARFHRSGAEFVYYLLFLHLFYLSGVIGHEIAFTGDRIYYALFF